MSTRTVMGRLAIVMACGGSLVGLGVGAAAGDPGRGTADAATGLTAGRYIVRYEPGTDMAAAAGSLRADGAVLEGTVTRAIDAAVVTLSAGEARALAADPGVLSVQPDVKVRVADTQASPTWGIDRIDQRSLPLSGSFTAPGPGRSVEAYVIDTGTIAHDDLAGRVTAGWSAVDAGDGRGDCNGHGTHVAATIAGTSYGVAKTATIIPVRVLSCLGDGFLSDVVAGIDWVVGQHQAGVPAVANMSLGGLANGTLDAAVAGMVTDGITVAVAAGNESADACTRSPARVPAALTVAATNNADQQAVFSNGGPCVDLFAPGVDITSAWNTSPNATNTISGTSMAAPHVAGTAAVLLSVQPGLSPAEVGARLVSDATNGVVGGTGANTPNRLLFLDQYAPPAAPPPPAPPSVEPPAAAPVTAPDRVGSVKAAPRSHAARVSWTPGADGGSPILQHRIRVYHDGDQVRSLVVPADAEHRLVEGLKPGVRYKFTVTSRNAVGRSPESQKSEAVEPRR